MIKKEKKLKILRFLFCLLVSAVLIAICSRSSPFYPFNNAADANCFFTVGKAMMNGVIPYRDIYEQKGPLLYFLYSLAYLVSNNTFFGVYLLETVAVAAFMLSVFPIVELYTDYVPYWVPVAVGAVIVASKSFALGGCSVEELCLPLLSWSLYHMLRLFRNSRFNKPNALRWSVIMLNGLFAGCVFWMKYTLWGFYIGWIAVVFVWYWIIDGIIPAIKTMLSFLLGAFAATLPWICFFHVNHALRDLGEVYFYNNIFLYSSFSGSLINTMNQCVINFLHAMYNNLWWFAPVMAGMLWLLIAPKKRVPGVEKVGIIITFSLLAAGVYIGGRAYAYYALILGVYTVFGAVPLLLLTKTLTKYIISPERRFVTIIYSAILIALCGVYAFCYSYNTYFFGADKEVMVQYKFSRIMHQLDDTPTLLNYGFMDGGFYTAANIVPTVKYFSALNIPYAGIREAQDSYLLSGCVDFAVTENAQLDLDRFSKYKLIYSDVFHSKNYSSKYYLYQLAESPLVSTDDRNCTPENNESSGG